MEFNSGFKGLKVGRVVTKEGRHLRVCRMKYNVLKFLPVGETLLLHRFRNVLYGRITFTVFSKLASLPNPDALSIGKSLPSLLRTFPALTFKVQ